MTTQLLRSTVYSSHQYRYLISSFLFFLVLLVLPYLTSSTPIPPTIKFANTFTNTEVRRFVDISTHVEEAAIVIKASNSGKDPASTYVVPVLTDKVDNLSFVEALAINEKEVKSVGMNSQIFQRLYKENKPDQLLTAAINLVDIPPTLLDSSSLKKQNFSFFSVTFPTPIPAGQSTSFILYLFFTRTLLPLPTHKLQDDQQLVIYYDNVYFLSPYLSNQQKSTFHLQSSHIEQYTRKHATIKSDEVEYGPFENTNSFSYLPLVLHAQNNSPFPTMIKFRKEIEISHWGNIAITEWLLLKHTGAQLTGPFSRIDYQRSGNQAPGVLSLLRASLPSYATDIYYKDSIGNVSTSHVRKSRAENFVEVQPRYPLFGGWEADFEIGYNVPSKKGLNVIETPGRNLIEGGGSTGDYLLNLTFGSMFASVAIDEAEVRVIFPEGSSNIHWSTPFDVDSEEYSLHFTHLDTTGRPVLILKKSNVVKYHNQHFLVSYSFSKASMLREPLIVMLAMMLLFGTAMIYYRVELGVGREDEKSKTE